MLYVSNRLVGVLLVGPECHTGSGFTGCDYLANYGHTDIWYQLFPTARQLHESHRRLDGCLFDVRLRSVTGIRPGQLRQQEWRPQGSPQTAASSFCRTTQVGYRTLTNRFRSYWRRVHCFCDGMSDHFTYSPLPSHHFYWFSIEFFFFEFNYFYNSMNFIVFLWK